MTNTIDKGVPLMKPTFFDDNDPNNPKRKTYIEREALLDNFYIYKLASASNYKHFAGLVKNAPSVDVVEVVRCKDCIYAHMTIDKEQVKYCDMFDSGDGVYFNKNHFCSYGERKVDSNER